LEVALLMLGTPSCSQCGLPLDGKRGGDKAAGDPHLQGPSSPAEPFRCCGVAHCPYCGLASYERCRHRVAWKERGIWRIPGLGLNRDSAAPDHNLPDDLLVDFDEDQKAQAWQSATCLLEPIYGIGFRRDPKTDQRLIAALAENVLGNTPSTTVGTAGATRVIRVHNYDRYEQYHFARDPDAARARAHKALADLAAGPERIKMMTPRAAQRHLLHQITLPEEAGPVSLVVFSPDSRMLLVGAKGEALLYEVATGTLLHRLAAPKAGPHYSYERLWASFSPDGGRVTVAAIQTPSSWPWERPCRPYTGPTAIYNTATGRKVTELGAMGGSSAGNAPSPGDAPEALVAGGHVLAQGRGRVVRLTAIDREGTMLLGEKESVRLPHRASVRHLAFAPDGRTFATSQDASPDSTTARACVLVWSVSPLIGRTMRG
jgi:WD40 repeat protein